MKRFGDLHSLEDFAARLGRSSRAARRLIEQDAGLRAAARVFAGTVWLPASALWAWWERQPGLAAWVPRVARPRSAAGKFFSDGELTADRRRADG